MRIMTEPYPNDGGLYCNLTFDLWDCWNYTRAGEVAVQPCPWWIVSSNPEKNATKKCNEDGTWFVSPISNQTWTNYSACYTPPRRSQVLIVFYVGYGSSIIALSIALFIFFYFRSLSCPRVTIHKNLFFSFILDALFQITFFVFVVGNQTVIRQDGVYCRVHNIMKHYFTVCNYFWMLSEGLYLHTVIVVAVFSENHVLLPYYIIGWVIPVIPAALFGTFLALKPPGPCWVGGTPFEWLIAGFIIFVLAVNLILLLNIVRVLVTKLRATPIAGSKNYTRAVRATLILLPLLGLHYIILPVVPPPNTIAEDIFEYVMAGMLSFQGLFVACIFCFFNGEVMVTLSRCITNFALTHTSSSLGSAASPPRQTKVKMQIRRKWMAHHWWRRDSDFRGRYANTTTITEACTVTSPSGGRIGTDQGCPLLKKSPNFIGNGSAPGGGQRGSAGSGVSVSSSSGGSLSVKYRPNSCMSSLSKTPEIEEIPEVKVENYTYKANGDIVNDHVVLDDDNADVGSPLMESVDLNTRTTEV
ncbi:calcitonin gene-related peptide type 1 receptor-like [Diadema antillarum]